LVNRGVLESQAKKLLCSLPTEQPVQDQLEYIDSIIKRGRGRIENPPGFYVSMLQSNIPVPDGFETSARQRAREIREHENLERQFIELEQSSRYDDYVQIEVDKHVLDVLGKDELQAQIKRRMPEFRKIYPNVPHSTLTEIAESAIRMDIRHSLPLLSFEQFKTGGRQFTLF
jgi:hypothetical protein